MAIDNYILVVAKLAEHCQNVCEKVSNDDNNDQECNKSKFTEKLLANACVGNWKFWSIAWKIFKNNYEYEQFITDLLKKNCKRKNTEFFE